MGVRGAGVLLSDALSVGACGAVTGDLDADFVGEAGWAGGGDVGAFEAVAAGKEVGGVGGDWLSC